MTKKNLPRGVADVTRATKLLNDRAPGAGDQLSQVIGHLSNRLDAQAGHRGTVAVAKQTTKNTAGKRKPGLNLSNSRLTGVAEPVEGKDAVTLDYWRRFQSCDAFAQQFEDCVRLETARVITGPSEWTFSSVMAQETYIFQDSGFVLFRDLQIGALPLPSIHNIAVIEMPALATNPPITLRGTYTGPLPRNRIAKRILPNEAEGVVYGASEENIWGAFGRQRMASYFNTISITPDNVSLVSSQQVLWLDGPPGADGVTIGAINGHSSYLNGRAIVFQSGNGSIITGQQGSIRFYVISPGGAGSVHIFDQFVGGIPAEGTIGGVSIGPGNIAYVVYNLGGDSTAIGTRYDLVSLNISGGPGLTLTNSQVIATGVPNTDALGATLWIQASGTKLHLLHAKYTGNGAQFDVHWKIYDITIPGQPVLKSDKIDPCNRWIGMHVQGDCVMLTEQGFGSNATLWDASDPANPRLLGGCRQTETPGFQQRLSHFLRDSRGYYLLTGLGGRFVIQDFIGHGISC